MNAAGSGNFAGIGVGAKGEPGFSPAQMKKHKKSNRPLRRFREIVK
jgi:hypothetical protein